MEIKYGEGTSEYGPGVDIVLSGDELAKAIFDYIKSQGAIIEGSMTARANGGGGGVCPPACTLIPRVW